MRIERILCPTDLSLNSAAGITYAYELAQTSRAELVILHVTTFPSVPLATLYSIDALPLERRGYMPPSVDQILRRAQKRLDAFTKPLVNSHCQTRVALGKPAEEIMIAAVQERADLIVMAKRRMGLVRRLISPSISERVSRTAPCPVLSVCPAKIQCPSGAQSRAVVGDVFVGAEG
jgi:nucleotide-binding universal stress UspA family protein